jgi:hypothetical protein
MAVVYVDELLRVSLGVMSALKFRGNTLAITENFKPQVLEDSELLI